MERNYLQPNNTYNASFAPNMAPAANQQQGANPQVRVLPPLADAADLSNNPAARNLQAYNTICTPQGPTDSWNAPEYQPIKPEELGTKKIADEAANTNKVELFLKHAPEYAAAGAFKEAEKAYKKALKHTENPEHYKLYATCLQKASTALKDATKANVYREKAARAFYYLGDLYKKQGALQDAQAAYKASSELALYELPLKALVEVARQLGDTAGMAAALGKLSDFYAKKGDTASAIKMLEEALQVEQSPILLEKLAALHGQAGGKDNQLKAYKTRSDLFELQVKQNPENIGAYREHAWFLKDIGRKDEARAVKKRMDDIFQQKLLKKKAKIAGLKETIHFKDEKLAVLEKQLQGSATETRAAIAELKKEQANSIRTLTTQFNTQLETLKGQVQANATQNATAIDGLNKRLVSLENLKLSQQVRSLNTLETELNDLSIRVDTLSQQVAVKNTKTIQNQSHIKHFEFSRKPLITDEELIEILRNNPQIEILNLQGCTNLTDAVLRAIPRKCQNLRELNLTNCNKMTENGFICILGSLELTPSLKKLNLTGIRFSELSRAQLLHMHIQKCGLTITGMPPLIF